MTDVTTSPYWVTNQEIKQLIKFLANKIELVPLEDYDQRDLLHNIQSELSVSQTRDAAAIFSSRPLKSVLDLPADSIPIRLSPTELTYLQGLPLPEKLLQKFQ